MPIRFFWPSSFDCQPAPDSDRGIVLGNLVAFHQVRVRVILPVEFRVFGNGAIQRQRRHHRVFNCLAVDDGQDSRHAEADGTDVCIRRSIGVIGTAAAVHLALRTKLYVHLQPDDGFVAHGCDSAHVSSISAEAGE